jgi:hypothetical protein
LCEHIENNSIEPIGVGNDPITDGFHRYPGSLSLWEPKFTSGNATKRQSSDIGEPIR